jgi:hypothetical protein
VGQLATVVATNGSGANDTVSKFLLVHKQI